MRIRWLHLVLIVVASCWVATAEAIPITYTETATVSGTLDGVPFSSEVITIVGSSDTSNVTGGLGFFQSLLTATFSISSVGGGTFTGNTYVFSNQGYPAAGFAASAGSILDTVSSAFTSYDLSTAIGPITGPPFIRPDLTFATTAGGLNLQTSGESTFAASTVPEPTTLLLLSGGLAGLALRRRRS